MKLSLAWVFDHIDADWKTIDVAHMITQFNKVVAEIEGFHKHTLDLAQFSVAEIRSVDVQQCAVYSLEWHQEYMLPARKGVAVGQYYIIKNDGQSIFWATGQDFGSDKEMALPAMYVPEDQRAGSWKKQVETHDYIIELDNKSVTNRPDMWGHRGFAREVAAMLCLPFKSADNFLAQKPVVQYADMAPSNQTNPIVMVNQASGVAKRFAGIYLSHVQVQPSRIWMAHRLARIDARPIDALVDTTNYAMFDWGHPMHAFDAATIAGSTLTVRMAKNKELLTVLDGETLELSSHDIVLADAHRPLGLAGIMGGKESAVSAQTNTILLEAAWFDPVTIRLSCVQHKKRTEASARFEKNLDPNNNVYALQRFLHIAREARVPLVESDQIHSLGNPVEQLCIHVEHDFIEKRLGVTIAPAFIKDSMERLEFGVVLHDGSYSFTVPTWRATKDIRIKEDIVEEIGRFYGYMAITPQLPRLALKPADLAWVYRKRTIKQVMAYAMRMRELYSYAFFDEEFLGQIAWNPGTTLEVKSPVSENWRRLVTTLIPGLIKAVVTNSAEHEALRFFELGRTWHVNGQQHIEKTSCAAIMYHKKGVSFYDGKAELQKVFDALNYTVSWVQVEQPEYPWYAPYQTAHLMVNDTKIGTAGIVRDQFLHQLCPGQAFIVELDADYMLHHKQPTTRYVAGSKYPDMVRDISILIAREYTAQKVSSVIASINNKITNVSLVDFFEKEQWPDQRAMTFRFVLSDKERTMTKEEADAVWDTIAHSLKTMGATIR